MCFRDYTIEEIHSDRKKAKSWFNKQKITKGWFPKTMKLWKDNHQKEVSAFQQSIKDYYNKIFIPSLIK